MNSRHFLLFPFLFLTALCSTFAESAPAEPGPENGGLRMRLTITPSAQVGQDSFDVRVELINVTKQAIILRANWEGGRGPTGDLKAYVEAAMGIETNPPIAPFIGQIMIDHDGSPSPQPEHLLPAGETLTVSWKSKGRLLKNRVTDPFTVGNPDFPTPGLYGVHAILALPVTEGTVLLRSNEQLVSIGGSVSLPKSTYGTLAEVDPETRQGRITLGLLHKIVVGDTFQVRANMGYYWKFTVTNPSPWYSHGKLEVVTVAESGAGFQTPPLPTPGTPAILVTNR